MTDWHKYWLLNPAVTFLNHGSFGACPIPVLEKQQHLREQLEREPLRFFEREWEPLLDAARNQLAEFVEADSADLVFVPNATTGVNCVLRSLQFEPGDELLTTDQEYNACRNALDFVASRTGARVVVAKVPFPINSPEQVVEAVLECVSPKTRLALLDHVASQTALIFPIQQLVTQLTARGVETLVDGAHAPGMIQLELARNWGNVLRRKLSQVAVFAEGAAFLYVQRDRQAAIHPLTISHGANSPRTDKSRFQLEFDWMGTDDPTAYLCVAEAIRFMGSLLPGGWPRLMSQNQETVLTARQLLCESLKVLPPCPAQMIGSMAVVPLPDESPLHEHQQPQILPPLKSALFEQFGIEVPVIYWYNNPNSYFGFQLSLYNTPVQYEQLANAITQVLSAE